MRKTICMVFAVCIILALSVIPSLTYNYAHYFGATVTVIHCGYNRDWEIEPKIPLAVVEISTSAPIQHKAWGAIRLPGEAWYEDSATYAGYTSYLYCSQIAYTYPNGLETDYGAVYP